METLRCGGSASNFRNFRDRGKVFPEFVRDLEPRPDYGFSVAVILNPRPKTHSLDMVLSRRQTLEIPYLGRDRRENETRTESGNLVRHCRKISPMLAIILFHSDTLELINQLDQAVEEAHKKFVLVR